MEDDPGNRIFRMGMDDGIGGRNMDVKKCDRCGAVYEYNKGGFVVLSNMDERQVDIRGKLLYDGEPAQKMDLCQGCLEAMTQWLKRR